MRYLMKEKMFSLGDDYKIQDEAGRDAFYVDGRAFSIGNKLSFQDMAGRELLFIRQKLLAWGPTYFIERDGQPVATVKKELFTFFHAKFSVDVPGPDDLEAVGSFLEREYAFNRGGREVAAVSRKWFSLTDAYAVDVADADNAPLILAAVVVIDLCLHAERNAHHSS